jgi:hypothetical protein
MVSHCHWLLFIGCRRPTSHMLKFRLTQGSQSATTIGNISVGKRPLRTEIKKFFLLHIRHQMEERHDYWLYKRLAMITLDFFMCLIVDGMDQNTTMVPKMRHMVKNIESRFVKTHLCGVLIHGIGLYADVRINAHHKHDSN